MVVEVVVVVVVVVCCCCNVVVVSRVLELDLNRPTIHTDTSDLFIL